MKKLYERPSLEIVEFETEDIITDSNNPIVPGNNETDPINTFNK